MPGSTLAYKRGASEPFLQRAKEHFALYFWTKGTNCFDDLMVIPSTTEMPATEIPQEALPCLILAKTESGVTVEVASTAICSFAKQPGLLKSVLLLKLLHPKIVERYPDGPEFDSMGPLEDREGEPFIIRGKGQEPEEMRDDELGPSNRKRPREPDYNADDEDSDARSHPGLKKARHYVIVSDEEEEPDTPEDDKTRDPDYNPFFKDDDDLFRGSRRKREEAVENQEMIKEESVGSNAEEKPPEPIKQPFKDIHGDNGFVEDDWYEPRGPDSLPYHYSERDIQHIRRRRAEKRAAVAEKEVINLTGDSD